VVVISDNTSRDRTTDNLINAHEHSLPLTISGKTDAENGQMVTVHIN
jgi:hypothetical protein